MCPIGILHKVAATLAVKISYLSPNKIIIFGLFFSKILTNFVKPYDIEFAIEGTSSFNNFRSILLLTFL